MEPGSTSRRLGSSSAAPHGTLVEPPEIRNWQGVPAPHNPMSWTLEAYWPSRGIRICGTRDQREVEPVRADSLSRWNLKLNIMASAT